MTYIAFGCNNCGHVVFADEHGHIVDEHHKRITRCPACGNTLHLPPALTSDPLGHDEVHLKPKPRGLYKRLEQLIKKGKK